MQSIPDAVDAVLARVLVNNTNNRITDELIVGIRAAVATSLEAALAPKDNRIPLRDVQDYHDYAFRHVYLGEWLPVLQVLHAQHWKETESYRHGLALNPNYDGMMALERIGQYMQFVVLHKPSDTVAGNGACYVQPCYHTGQLVATEDTWFLLPEHRKGLLAAKFLKFMESCVASLGVQEVRVSVKMVNNVNVLLERMGYGHVANQYSKLLGEK